MKSMIALGLLVTLTSANASEFLLKKAVRPGFMPNPTYTETTITESGKVKLLTQTHSTKSLKTVKEISPNQVQKIKDLIDAVNPKLKVIDLDANKPRCMDAPSRTYSITKNDKEVVIGGWSGCHRSQMNSKAAQELIKIISEI